MLTVIGDLIADVIVLGAHSPELGTDNPAVITHARGGSAANVAAALAAQSIPVRFIGRVGTDAAGDALVHELAATGVEVLVQRGGRTGSIVILVDELAERTMLTDRGAAARLEAIDQGWLEGTRWLHLPLYGLVEDTSRAAVREAARWARERGIPISVDLSSTAAMRQLGAPLLGELLETLAPAVVFANQDEAQLFGGGSRAAGVARSFVIKRGADPIVLFTGADTIEIPVERVADVVDTTGAGDAFAAGFLAAMLGGQTPVDCAKAGAALARGALPRPGAI